MIRAFLLVALALALAGCGGGYTLDCFGEPCGRTQPHYDPGLAGAVRSVMENQR